MLLRVRYLDRNGAHLKSRGVLWQGRDDDKPACVEAAEDVRSLVLPLLYVDWCTPTFRKCSFQPFISQNPSIFPISWSQPMRWQYLEFPWPMRVHQSLLLMAGMAKLCLLLQVPLLSSLHHTPPQVSLHTIRGVYSSYFLGSISCLTINTKGVKK